MRLRLGLNLHFPLDRRVCQLQGIVVLGRCTVSDWGRCRQVVVATSGVLYGVLRGVSVRMDAILGPFIA